MPIKVSCHCGQSFTAKDELRGQTLLCPKCHQPLTIGEGQQKAAAQHSGGVADLLDEVGLKEIHGPRCPRCAAGLRPDAVMCVACGFHLQTKEQIRGVRVRKAGERGHGEAAEELLSRAADAIIEDKLEEKKNRSQGLPAWVYFLMLIGLGAFTVAMFMIPRERAFLISGMCVMGAGGLGSLYYGIRMLIVAFNESVACGIMYLLIPFYSLYYIITRWDQCGGYFLMSLATGAVSGIGQILIAVSPMMAAKPEGAGQSWVPAPHSYAVVAALDPTSIFTGNES
jgi:hypothetical protein